MLREILVMDSEERESFWMALRSDYKVLFAATAEEGLSMLSAKVDLVFLSMRLPDMDSPEVLRRIRKAHPSTAVSMIASGGADGARTTAPGGESGDSTKRSEEAGDLLEKIRTLIDSNDGFRRHRREPREEEAVQDETYPDVPPHLVGGILRVRDFIVQHYSESLPLPAACKMASVSKTYFCRFFKSITGHSLRSYYHVVRVRRAEELLQDRRLSIREVAQRVGYDDPNYFSTIYKRISGIPPRRRQASDRDLRSGKMKERRLRL